MEAAVLGTGGIAGCMASKRFAGDQSERNWGISGRRQNMSGKITQTLYAESKESLVKEHPNPADGWGAITRSDGVYIALEGEWIPHNQSPSFGETKHESISTGEVLNSDLGDAVDYSDPRWLLRSDYYDFKTSFESLDGFDNVTQGSGIIEANSFFVTLNTGSTSGSVAQIRKIPFVANPRPNDADRDRIFKMRIEILDSDSGRVDYYSSGEVGEGSPGFGFKLSGGDLLGVVHDGASETTTTIISNVGARTVDLRAEFIAGEEVNFYSGGYSGTIDSDLPSGSQGSFEKVMYLRTENTTAATRRVRTSQFRVIQLP
ncbi:hypothetical protein [Halomicrobium sp. IBSBa]|uniref:hypothetical protein n=1 Tax=Halomicrobium sp. IBSBa TaxID=2778916 RepID=UPI001ABF1682|nr:hypothetical protein [Halomicrobium sp. IBSBa]